MCMFCRSLFVLVYFFFWPLFCLFFFDIQIMITPLISSNSSYMLAYEHMHIFILLQFDLTMFEGILTDFFL